MLIIIKGLLPLFLHVSERDASVLFLWWSVVLFVVSCPSVFLLVMDLRLDLDMIYALVWQGMDLCSSYLLSLRAF